MNPTEITKDIRKLEAMTAGMPKDRTKVHVSDLAPSTILTPKDWKHVMIHPDAGGRFKLTGYASATVWLPGDLKALGVKVTGGKVWGMTKDRAVEIGQQIEDAMRRAKKGEPLKSLTRITRDKFFTPAEAEKDQVIRDQIEAEFPPAKPKVQSSGQTSFL